MNQIEITVMSLLDILGYLIISNKITSGINNLYKMKKIFFIYVTIILLSLTMGVIGISPIGKYSFVAGSVLIILFIYFLYRRSLKETIIIYILSTIILLIIQLLILAILLVLKIDRVLDFNGGLIAQSFILSILFLIHRYVPLNLLFNYTYKKNKLFIGLILNMFIVLISILTYRYVELDGLLKDIMMVAILSIGLLFVNLVLLKNGLKNEYEEKMLHAYEKHLPIIDELMGEIRAKQHEFDNHIQALHMITITSTDYNSIVDSMQKYMKELEFDTEMKSLLKLENKVLAGFLYGKIKKAKYNKIDFQITIDNYGFRTNLRDYELIEVIGNLIDNAFETGIENNIVILSFSSKGNMTTVQIKNKHPYLNNATISHIFKSGYSTKSINGHGYGLSNIKRIVNYHDGVIGVKNESINEENYVVFSVLLK